MVIINAEFFEAFCRREARTSGPDNANFSVKLFRHFTPPTTLMAII